MTFSKEGIDNAGSYLDDNKDAKVRKSAGELFSSGNSKRILKVHPDL